MLRFLVLGGFLVGCRPDDVKDDTGGGSDSVADDSGDSTPPVDDLVGSWLSEGANISPLFAASPYNYVSITAVFNADATYSADGVQDSDGDGAGDTTYTFSGTYTTDLTTEPHTIALTQTSPSADTATGIWDVDGDTLTYEVLSAQAASVCDAPTPEGGFGSTSCRVGNYEDGFNIQVYVR